jgi:cation diffusion facilitator CzcD-associated flavoprotein CzcO
MARRSGLFRLRADTKAPGGFSVIVVGAGFGGLSAGILLKKAGIENFDIYEKSGGVGGTWWDSHYPGAEVDVPSHAYSFPFKRYLWSRTHARQSELARYIDEVVDEQGLRPHITLNTGVIAAVWREERQQYEVTLSNGEVKFANVLISAVGMMNLPYIPDWPGLDTFRGPAFHTARWQHEHDLSDKRVAVVGTGSSASQVVATIAPDVKQLYVYQREPGWVIPKGDHDYSEEELREFAAESWFQWRKNRLKQHWAIQSNQVLGGSQNPNSKSNKKKRVFAEQYAAEIFKERPDLLKALVPKYELPGKRLVINGNYFPAFLRDNVELIPRAVERVTETGIVDAEGTETPVDVIVLATGFHPADFIASMRVVGRNGRTLQETWRGEPQAFLGVTVPNFPNFFMLYGPNTHGGEIFTNHRVQAGLAVRSIKRMERTGSTNIEVRRLAYELFDIWLQSRMKRFGYLNTNNYTKSPSARVVTQWPYDAISYAALGRIFGRLAHRAGTIQTELPLLPRPDPPRHSEDVGVAHHGALDAQDVARSEKINQSGPTEAGNSRVRA